MLQVMFVVFERTKGLDGRVGILLVVGIVVVPIEIM